MTKTIVLCNQKGGVAKTTTAINLASYLAIENQKTLLVDIDPQSNSTSGVGINKHDIEKNIYHALLGQAPLDEIIIPTQIEKLFLVPANINLTGAEIELASLMGREYKLKSSLQAIKDQYDFIIVDCPPSLGLLTINGLCAADSVLIPIQCEYYALEGLSQLINTVNLVQENLNPALQIEGVLLTMADFRTKLAKEVVLEVRKHFKNKVYGSIIRRSIKLSEAPSFGKPIALYDKDSIGAAQYHELAREVLRNSGITLTSKTDELQPIIKEERKHDAEIGQRP